MFFRGKRNSSICRNSQHQTTKILSRQPISNRIRANPHLTNQTNQSFINNNQTNFNVATHLLNNQSVSSRTVANKQSSSVLNNELLISQVEMPAQF